MAEVFTQNTDLDPQETVEWMDSLDSVLKASGPARTRYIVRRLIERAQVLRVGLPALVQRPYINSIAPEDEPAFPGDEQMERKIRRLVRWNAVAQVVRANQAHDGLGGHLASYASAASLYEVGFNHFFRGASEGDPGDQIYFQGHAAPGVYARAFLEGRLSAAQLDRFRREIGGAGLSSYPHPRLMPEFWQFPTVSMGLGPIHAIYQARFNRYLHNRGLVDTSRSRVWAFLGDGECDEPETLGALTLGSREQLDNLIFVVNCNLQRLDGPVRGNGKIIQELEAAFHGAGWNVIKVIWGRDWDELIASDEDHILVRRFTELLDGHFQRYSVETGAYIREHVAGGDPRILALLERFTDDQLRGARRGGHDYRKIYAAYQRATEHRGQPTVILAKTVKGWTLGKSAEGRNITHQVKNIEEEELRKFRDRLELPIADADLAYPPFYHPGARSPEIQYMLERRAALGGFVPSRRTQVVAPPLPQPDLFAKHVQVGKGDVSASTTMAFARLFRDLLKDSAFGKRVVPIIADEARTFGMEPLFKQVGIYAHAGQLYEPVDHDILFSYSERRDGQILEEGITECGSLASFAAAGTSYATHGTPMVPFFIFYSMFGFQRVGDAIWAAADQRARGFLLGATAGRTTLNGEGLQHQDGHSLLVASTVPSCVSYDPAYGYEVAVIIREGLRRMVEAGEDVFYYLALYNEKFDMPAMPAGAEDGILKGIYRVRESKRAGGSPVRLLGSGSLLPSAIAAAEMLEGDFEVGAEVFSVTSYQELRREALACERTALWHPEQPAPVPYVTRTLPASGGPVIAVSDFVRAVPDQIARWVPGGMTSLGTDGFGASDTREELRRFFRIDTASIVLAALSTLARAGEFDVARYRAAVARFEFDLDRADPSLR
ncbi:MAG: pyruvate dehydrogenase (acetyl-transferring), homodimeric type [Planctomycetota bacterium]